MPKWFNEITDTFRSKPRSAASARHGRVPIPGEAALDLPAGLVRVYYEVDEGGSGGLVRAPFHLRVRVYDGSGHELPFQRKAQHLQSTWKGFGGNGRSYLGWIEVTSAGPHAVTTELDGSLPVPARLCLGD